MKRAPAILAALLVAGFALAGGFGVGSGGLQGGASGGSSTSGAGTALGPNCITTADGLYCAVVDAGVVNAVGALYVGGDIIDPAGNGINFNPGASQSITSTPRNWGANAAADVWLGGLRVPTNKAVYLNTGETQGLTSDNSRITVFGAPIDLGDSTGGRSTITGDTTAPAIAAFRLIPQDAQPTGASLVGDMYVTTAGVLRICTVAGTPGTWVNVGAQ